MQSAGAGGTVYTSDNYTWLNDPAGNPYISEKDSATDPSGSNPQYSKTTQTLDQFGNMTQSAVYPYNASSYTNFSNSTPPLNVYNSTYLTDSGYLANYIRNRVLSTTLTTGGSTITLAQNYYDGKYSSFGEPTLPAWAQTNCNGSWGPATPDANTTMFDFSPPVTFSSRGLLSVSNNPAKTSCTAYDAYGGVRAITGSDGSTMNSASDSSTNYAAPSSISTQSYGETIAYNTWLGVTGTTGLNGETLSMTYDSYGRPATGSSPYGGVWTYGYTSTTPIQQTKTGPDGFTRTTLDGLGRTIRVERGLSSSSIQSVTDTVYAPCACSPLGKIQKVSAPYSPSAGASAWTVYAYDGIGRTVSTSVQRPEGTSTSTYSYSGNQTTATDEAGKWKTFTSDVVGNLTTVTEPDPANPPSGTLTTHYGYDWMKHLVCVDMVRGATPPAVACDPTWQTPAGAVRQTRNFVYNGSGLLTSATNPENGTVLYYYNADNTLNYKHDAKGQDTVYTYDSAKRVTEVQRYPKGKNNSEDTCGRVLYSYTANPVNPSFSQNSAGRPTTVSYSVCTGGSLSQSTLPYSSAPGGSVTEMYSYHPAGAVIAKQMLVSRSGVDSDGNSGSGYGGLEVDYGYDSAGNVLSYGVKNALASGAPPQTYTYSYDGMERPVGLTTPYLQPCIVNTGNESIVQNVSYDFAGRMTGMQYKTGQTSGSTYAYLDPDNCGGWGYYTQYTDSYTSKAMAYNATGQMTSLGWSGGSGVLGTIAYTYSATQNNGQVTGVTDSISGETIVYQYDALKRLTSASSTATTTGPANGGPPPAAWTQAFSYDGFGNLTGKVLNGGMNQIPATNSATNQLAQGSYDANGNMTSGIGLSLAYDEANRVVSATQGSGGTEYYGYAPDNKRIYRLTPLSPPASGWTEEWTFYGAKGERLVTNMQLAGPLEVITPQGVQTGWNYAFTGGQSFVWFAGTMIGSVYQDRLGTDRSGGARFYPYGDEITSTSNDRVKFATYTRDGFTKLDYADQRFYASAYGRYLTVDPKGSSAKANNPASLNRYTYVGGDPINLVDPRGLEQYGSGPDWIGDASLSGPCCPPPDGSVDPACYAGGGGSGGGGGGGGGGGNGFADDPAVGGVNTILSNNVQCDQLLFGPNATTDSAQTRFSKVQVLPSSQAPPDAPPLGPAIVGGTQASWGATVTWGTNDGINIYLNSNYFPNDTAANINTPWGQSLSAVSVFNHSNGTSLNGLQVEEAVILHELWHIGNKTPDSTIDSAAGTADLIAKCFP